MGRRTFDDDEERPRWRDADEDDDAPREWEEVEPEEEKGDSRPVLGGTEPVARFLFLVILGCVLVGGVVALIFALGRYVRS